MKVNLCFTVFSLLDLHAEADGEYNYYLMNVQDHLTKFTHLRALKSKTAQGVADNLLDIFLVFGALAILHSDNGREFRNSVVRGLQAHTGRTCGWCTVSIATKSNDAPLCDCLP